MAGTIFLPDGRDWDVRSGIFFWALDTLAEQVQDQDLASWLRELSENNVGLLDVKQLSKAQQQDFAISAQRLPSLARTALPEAGESFYDRMEELAALVAES
ncbi:hypothetical protein [Kineosporia sp. NBRC 101731]|uniref:hypothetical protein n=1 Tax=Kineosporia sp. NBRC 101731 TaxID=3032199 RepID=UPI0024A524F7|nr:hypothetical protein [Kineosporia sp. NBRC 101731]GLY33111.1 hypothetical protein Kisp02_64760 [Kineosporia sp. NBRC 101731]